MITRTCPKCYTELKDAPGIGPYCPNKDCDVIDNLNGAVTPVWQFTGDRPYKERYNMATAYTRLDEGAMDEIDAAMFSGDIFHDRENIANLRAMMARWEKGLKECEEILLESER